jgi:hypothetical protein
LLTSDKATPATPSVMNPDWKLAGQVTQGAGDDVVPFSPINAQHVALIFDDTDCGTVWGLHSVSELSAMTVPDVPQPPAVAPSCSGGESASVCN